MWRKRQTCAKLAPNVHHNEQNPSDLVNILTNSSIKSEQKHDILTYPLDILHDLSIKSEDLSIKSKEHMKYEDIKFFNQRCEEHPDHQSGMISNSMIQQRLHEEIDELREYIEQKLKENT